MMIKNHITTFLGKTQNYSPCIPHILTVTNETNFEPDESSDDSLEDHYPLYMAKRPQTSQTQQGILLLMN